MTGRAQLYTGGVLRAKPTVWSVERPSRIRTVELSAGAKAALRRLGRRLALSESALRGLIREDRRRFNNITRDRVLAALGIPITDWYGE
jgi:hypothetical protein